MTINNNYTGLSPVQQPENFNRNVSVVVNRINNGHVNVIGEVDIAASATSIEVEDERVTNDSVIHLMALDSDSAGISYYVTTDMENRKFTITCTSSVNDRQYRYTIFG